MSHLKQTLQTQDTQVIAGTPASLSPLEPHQGRLKAGIEDHSTCVDFTVDYQLSLKETLLEKTPAYGLFKWLELTHD